ncbi:MAG: hypothetical protein IJH63_00345 [Methanobrevibacter sp.]|nr:hypothetical protein [Methanosphaera sp.]MBR0369153.1 hypothetical protein [Methanobrevibacter sp.]
MSNKTEENKEKVVKNEKTTKKTTKNADKKILVDLVQASDVRLTSIIMDLSKHGLIDQYYEELANKQKGLPNTPSITEAEFKKIIGD